MTAKLYPLGRLWCPRCFASRLFVGHDDPDPSAAACIDCGYQFGYTTNLRTGAIESVLTREVVQEARAKLAEEMARDALASGVSSAVERANALLGLPPAERMKALQPATPGSGWTPEQWRSFAEHQRSGGE